jgi:hypothetical protein
MFVPIDSKPYNKNWKKIAPLSDLSKVFKISKNFEQFFGENEMLGILSSFRKYGVSWKGWNGGGEVKLNSWTAFHSLKK